MTPVSAIETGPTPPRATRPARDPGRRYLDWWISDLPRMHGLPRFGFYGALFLLAHDYPTSPLHGIHFYEARAPSCFARTG